jgi:hypothetical protein
MNVMVMDVEGTDGRERGEDQVRAFLLVVGRDVTGHESRTLSAKQLFSPWPRPRCSSLTCGSTKSAYTKARTWACSKPYSKSTSDSLERKQKTGARSSFPLICVDHFPPP